MKKKKKKKEYKNKHKKDLLNIDITYRNITDYIYTSFDFYCRCIVSTLDLDLVSS